MPADRGRQWPWLATGRHRARPPDLTGQVFDRLRVVGSQVRPAVIRPAGGDGDGGAPVSAARAKPS